MAVTSSTNGDRADELGLGEPAGQARRRAARPGSRRRRRSGSGRGPVARSAGGRALPRRRRAPRRRRSSRPPCAASRPTSRSSAGIRSEPRIRPTMPPSTPIPKPLTDGGAGCRGRSRGRRLRLRLEQLVGASRRATAAMNSSSGVSGSAPPIRAAGDRAGDRRRRHPREQAPVDAARRGCGRSPRWRRRSPLIARFDARCRRRRRRRRAASPGRRMLPSTRPTRPPASATTKHQMANRTSSTRRGILPMDTPVRARSTARPGARRTAAGRAAGRAHAPAHRSTRSSARSTCWPRAARCARRSSRAPRTR